jgi:excinuclease UvrABC helicase subunit UvrB
MPEAPPQCNPLAHHVRKHAQNDRFKLQFDQWRPYVTMMNARARATPLVRQEKFAEALEIVEAGIGAIRDFLDEYGQTQRAHECVELVNLEQWHEEIHRRQQATPSAVRDDLLSNLRRQLEEAVASEEFEEAARLRDEIRRLGA